MKHKGTTKHEKTLKHGIMAKHEREKLGPS
jgi:hypothetical protein